MEEADEVDQNRLHADSSDDSGPGSSNSGGETVPSRQRTKPPTAGDPSSLGNHPGRKWTTASECTSGRPFKNRHVRDMGYQKPHWIGIGFWEMRLANSIGFGFAKEQPNGKGHKAETPNGEPGTSRSQCKGGRQRR